MAIFKSVIKILKPNKTHFSNPTKRSFLTLSNSYTHSITPFQQFHIRQHFLFRPRFHFFLPFRLGPPFLSNPPWKLSQYSTPLLLQSDKVLSFIKARAVNLIEKQRTFREYGYRYEDTRSVVGGVCVEELGNGNGGGVVNAGLSESYFNVPNLISFARMASGPVIGWMIIHDMYSSAFACLAISGSSDWLDGYVARKMKINSVVGSYLDPLADKVLIGCVALAMVEKGLLHPGLVGLVLARDIALVGGAVYKRASKLEWERSNWRDFLNLDEAHVQKIEPLMISKVNTVFQLALVAAALLQPVFGSQETQLYIDYLSWLVASTTVASTAAYGAQYLKSNAAMIKSSKFKN